MNQFRSLRTAPSMHFSPCDPCTADRADWTRCGYRIQADPIRFLELRSRVLKIKPNCLANGLMEGLMLRWSYLDWEEVRPQNMEACRQILMKLGNMNGQPCQVSCLESIPFFPEGVIHPVWIISSDLWISLQGNGNLLEDLLTSKTISLYFFLKNFLLTSRYIVGFKT